MTGYVHVYTGNGKGKTTAALGLALRAAGAGMNVFIAQFAKGQDYSELHSVSRLSDRITLKQYGSESFIRKHAQPEDIKRATEGLTELKGLITSGKYQLIVLDEANIATYFNLFTVADLVDLIDSKPASTELVITGRYADPQIISKADLVTEMREVKHYYSAGVQARVGIEN